jgi:hypothetical protein
MNTKNISLWFRSITLVAKAAGEEWKAMPEKEKATWKQRAEADKERYAQEKAGNYNAGGGDSDEDDGASKKKARK